MNFFLVIFLLSMPATAMAAGSAWLLGHAKTLGQSGGSASSLWGPVASMRSAHAAQEVGAGHRSYLLQKAMLCAHRILADTPAVSE